MNTSLVCSAHLPFKQCETCQPCWYAGSPSQCMSCGYEKYQEKPGDSCTACEVGRYNDILRAAQCFSCHQNNIRTQKAPESANFVQWDSISRPRARGAAKNALVVNSALSRGPKPAYCALKANTKTRMGKNNAIAVVRAISKTHLVRPQPARRVLSVNFRTQSARTLAHRAPKVVSKSKRAKQSASCVRQGGFRAPAEAKAHAWHVAKANTLPWRARPDVCCVL